MAAKISPEQLAAAIKRYRGEPQYAPGQTNANGRLICGAKKRGQRHGPGEPCQTSPVQGGTRCTKHGGKSPKAQDAATGRIMEAEAIEILGRIDPDGINRHPVEHLLNLINQKAAEVAWLRTKVQNLNEYELTWGLTKEESGTEKGMETHLKTEETGQNIWWQLLRTAEEQLAKWAGMAVKAGVEERRIRLAEEQGQLVVQAIQQILDGLNLTPAQTKLIPQIVPEALRQLSTENQ